MKNQLTILLVAICFTALISSLTFVIAENDTGVKILGNNASNMTFGKCVEQSVVIRQGCYAESKNSSNQCADRERLGANKEQAKQCLSNYKENKKNCKNSFKEAKITCIQVYKPGFWERIRHTFD